MSKTPAGGLTAALIVMALALAGCGQGEGGGAGGKGPSRPAVVTAAAVGPHDFLDAMEAIGTAYARESVTITSSVTERVKVIRFRDGDAVRKGDILVEMVSGEEAADLASMRARMAEAQAQLARADRLVRDGYTTRSRLDELRAERDAARGNVAVIEARLADRVIRAPFAGEVGLRRVSPGLVVSAGDPIVDLVDTSTIKLDFTIPEAYASAVRLGQELRATSEAYPEQTFRGVIEGIDPQVDAVTRSVQVRAVLPNPDRRLKPGMLMTAQIVRSVHTGLAVPEQALFMEGDSHFVYRIEGKEPTAFRTRVVIGRRAPGWVEVTAGIKAGQQIVADGVVKLRDATPVSILAAEPVKQASRP